MASKITVKIKYTDNSKSLSEDYSCADRHPSPHIIKDCENNTIKKWTDMGGSLRDTQIHTTVKS